MTLARMRSRTVATATLLALACTTTACATYRPIDPRVAPGAGEVRVQLTDRGALELAAVVGPSMRALDGQVREASDSVLVLGLVQSVTRDGQVVTWRGEAVRVPTSWVASVERRISSRGRTALLGAGIAAAVVALGAGFANGGSALGGPRDGSGRGN